MEKPRFCSRCGQPILVPDASFCKDCGAPLGHMRWPRYDIAWNPFMAFALSIVPGLGHVYRRRPGKALAWFFGVLVGYALSTSLGIMLQLVCAANAALADAARRKVLASSPSARGPGANPLARTGGPHLP